MSEKLQIAIRRVRPPPSTSGLSQRVRYRSGTLESVLAWNRHKDCPSGAFALLTFSLRQATRTVSSRQHKQSLSAVAPCLANHRNEEKDVFKMEIHFTSPLRLVCSSSDLFDQGAK